MQLDESLNQSIIQFDPAPRHQHGVDGKAKVSFRWTIYRLDGPFVDRAI